MLLKLHGWKQSFVYSEEVQRRQGSSQLSAHVWPSVVEELSQGNTCSCDNYDDATPTCATHSQWWQGCNTDIAMLLQLWHQSGHVHVGKG